MDGNPQAKISNGILNARFYLPDATDGYYRATRFDWSGIISSLEYNGHNYYGKWFENYSPTAHNSIMGPVNFFGPLNYNEAKPGGSFVKIGVGKLKKLTNQAYEPFTYYPIIDPGSWEVKREAVKIQFHHVLKDKDFPYEYTKTIEFVEGKPEMLISYKLKNKGKKVLETEVMNHNFFVFDYQPVRYGLVLTFPVKIAGSGRGIGDIAEIVDNKIVIERPLEKGESVYCSSVEGISNMSDYTINVNNNNTGTGVRMKGDLPLSKLVFWCNPLTICPETYIKIKIAPGEEISWKNIYDFYAGEIPSLHSVL